MYGWEIFVCVDIIRRFTEIKKFIAPHFMSCWFNGNSVSESKRFPTSYEKKVKRRNSKAELAFSRLVDFHQHPSSPRGKSFTVLFSLYFWGQIDRRRVSFLLRSLINRKSIFMNFFYVIFSHVSSRGELIYSRAWDTFLAEDEKKMFNACAMREKFQFPRVVKVYKPYKDVDPGSEWECVCKCTFAFFISRNFLAS